MIENNLKFAGECVSKAISDPIAFSPALIFLDQHSLVTGWSEGARHLLGWSADDVLASPLSRFKDDLSDFYRAKDGRTIKATHSITEMPQGGFVLTLQAVPDAVSNPIGFGLEQQLELTLSHTSIVGMWNWDIASDLVFADERFASFFGVDPVKAKLGLAIVEFMNAIHPEDRMRVQNEIKHTIKTGQNFASEYRIQREKKILHVEARGRVLIDESAQPVRFSGVLFDLTAQRKAEYDAALSMGRYQSLFEKIDAGFCIVKMIFDENGKPVDYLFLDANLAFENQTGFSNVAGKRVRDIAPFHEQHWIDVYGGVALTGKAIKAEQPGKAVEKVNGVNRVKDCWMSVQVFPIDDPLEHHVAILFADITERKQHELALVKSEADFRTLSQAMLQQVWTATPEGQLDWFNDRTYEFLSHQKDNVKPDDGWMQYVHPNDVDDMHQAWQAAIGTGGLYQHETRLRRHDGIYHWHLIRAAPVRDDSDTIIRWVGTNTDIETQKKNEAALAYLNATLEYRIEERTAELLHTQEVLRQSQKMEAIGNLAGGIAHDFNNLLQVISGNLQLVSNDVAGHERTHTRVHNALSAVQRGAKLSHQLLAFSRRQPLEPKVVNLGRLVRDMDDIFRRSLGEAIEIDTIISGGLWNTLVDPANVENALLNLAINARDAMQGQGKLTIEAGNAYLDDTYVNANADIAAGQYVLLAVTDTGCGMASDVIEKVFDPFFTTKPVGKGTGLGLSMVYGFIKQSGGHIKVYSEIGVGTTIKLYLPRAIADEDILSSGDTQPVIGGRETILVAEDDTAVRETTVNLLKDLGYTVHAAKDADSALALLESDVHVDLLFTDVVMPGKLKSIELARRARELFPNIAVLFTSGYTENSIVHGGRLDAGVSLLSKPYTREALARRLRQLLNEKAARMTGDRKRFASS